MSIEEKKKIFIEKAIASHPGEKLDYSQVEYVNSKTPVKIIDHDLDENGIEYGEFYQTPSNHLKGQSHPRKKSCKIHNKKSYSQEEIISKFKEVHKNENLDYSEVHYVNMHTKVKIIDHDLDKNGNEYGEFWQDPASHLKGCSHPRKAIDRNTDLLKYTTDIFIDKAKSLYGESAFSYDFVNYINSKTKVDIFCNKIGSNNKPHGHFLAYPDLFLQGKACPICGNHKSIAEDEIYDFLSSIVGSDNIKKNDRTLLDGLELDLYIPSLHFAIEYNGLKWHSEEYKNDKFYHINKTKLCEEHGVSLIQIFEDEYLTNKKIILDKIGNFICYNQSKPSIYARKCLIREISGSEAKLFLNNNHIQGYASSSIYLGCLFEDKLIGVMTFKKENKNNNNWELNRFATDVNYKCPGVASKLFNYFIKKYNPDYIKSFLDRRWCFNTTYNLYTILGFNFKCLTAPDYRYTNGHGNRIHKFSFRKKILHKKYNLPLSMCEREMSQAIGYYKIWDCGLIKYEWIKKKGPDNV